MKLLVVDVAVDILLLEIRRLNYTLKLLRVIQLLSLRFIHSKP